MSRWIFALLIGTGALFAPAFAQDEPFTVSEATTSFPSTLDPHTVFAVQWDRYFRAVYESPLACDQRTSELTIVPRLLTELPSLSKDGKEMTLHFREGVRFVDDTCFEGGKGREVTADDFVYMLLRHTDPATESLYYGPYLSGWIEGLQEARTVAERSRVFDYDAKIPGIVKVSRYVVKLRFIAPYPKFPALLTMTWASILPREAVRRYGSGLSSRTVGTGPYVYDGPASNDKELVFRRNAAYWRRTEDGGTLPLNDGVRFHFVPTLEFQAKRFGLGDLSLLDVWPVNLDEFFTPKGRVRRKVRPRKCRVVETDLCQFHYIAFNMRNKILSKKKVRQALCLALDRKSLVKSYYKGAARLADHLVPPSLPLHAGSKPLKWRYGRFALAEARKLLAEAGYPGGEGLPEFILEAGADQEHERKQLEMIRDQWARLGVKLQLRGQPFADFVARTRKGLPEISVNYWFADYPDPENFLLMLRSAAAPIDGVEQDAPNVGFYQSKEYDALYEKAALVGPGKERGKIYRRMIEIVQEDCPWVFVAHPFQFSLIAPGVDGVVSRSSYAIDYSVMKRAAVEK